jgi:hypothetical protein|tara:strand:- start:6105 stop:6998 length:894 start_codon:yes stop_codon:yes gene_type:complete
MAQKQTKNQKDGTEVVGKAVGVPVFKNAWYENTISHNGAWIVLGKDRPSNEWSGRSQESHAHSIDMVVGRSGLNVEETGPNFKSDAARIWISEKTDVDAYPYFELKDNRDHGGVPSPTSKSAIGLKADSIRIVGREGVKIVTGGGPGNIGSKDTEPLSIQGIDLMAGNYAGPPIQPLVRGNNMVDCVNRILNYIQDLHEMLYGFMDTQAKWNETQTNWNTVLQNHVHPPALGVTPPSLELEIMGPGYAMVQGLWSTVMATQATGIFNEKANVVASRNKYLGKNNESTYICSKYNNTN